MTEEKATPNKKTDYFFYLLLVWNIAALWYALCYEPQMFDREKIHASYVAQTIHGRLPAWIEYSEDVDFYFVENESESSRAACTYNNMSLGFRDSDIYIYTNDLVSDELFGRLEYCVYHEVGHSIDYKNGEISGTDHFRSAVDKTVEMWQDLPEGAYHWRSRGEMVANFPGILGNPSRESGWGGYHELYAVLHETNYLIQIPPPLQAYFEDFIPWIWYEAE
jgi:hypothetical protein